MIRRPASSWLFVDHVLGWGARPGDGDAADAGGSATDVQTGSDRGQGPDEKAGLVDVEDSRPEGRRFPYGG